MRERLQKSALVAAACLGVALPGAIAAQVTTVTDQLWDTFLRVCPLMLTKPQDYANSLAIPGPDGERVISQMSGGNVIEFDTTIDDFPHSGLIVAIGKHQEIGCSLSAFPTAGNLAELKPAATHPVFERRISAFDDIIILGGLVDKEVPVQIAGYPPEKVNNYYQYWVTGLVPGADTVANIFIGEGTLSFHMHHYLVGEDNG